MQALKPGFQLVTLSDVEVLLGSQVKLDVTLPVGAQEQKIEVIGGASALGTTPTQEHGISPETLNQLPLLMYSGPRAAATFAMLMPGVSTGGGNDAFDARMNGGLQSGDEASRRWRQHAAGLHEPGRHGVDLPGLSDVARHGERGQGADVELCARVRLVDVGGQIMAVTKSGGSSFHGAGFEFHRDDSLKADAVGRDEKPARSSKQQLRRQHRRAGRSAGALVGPTSQELLLFRLRGVSADGRLESADAVDPVDAGT